MRRLAAVLAARRTKTENSGIAPPLLRLFWRLSPVVADLGQGALYDVKLRPEVEQSAAPFCRCKRMPRALAQFGAASICS
jgi:hypothetical protein